MNDSSHRKVPADEVPALLLQARERSPVATGRLLSMVESGGAAAEEVARAAFPLAGACYALGVTGPPGAGKSTLTAGLVGQLRQKRLRVAVLAIDPSSPFSGGAILGDRIRMREHVLDPDVFIRSMATRGHLGGLALAVPEAIRLLDAAGFDWVLLETVGVGQVEVDVARLADTTVVVVNPGWGDDVQAAKAGLLEVADVFAINKADRNGALETQRELEYMLSGTRRDGGWRPPTVSTIASQDIGSDDLLDAIERHRNWLQTSQALRRRREERLWNEVEQIVRARLHARARQQLEHERAHDLYALVTSRSIDPWAAAERLMAYP